MKNNFANLDFLVFFFIGSVFGSTVLASCTTENTQTQLQEINQTINAEYTYVDDQTQFSVKDFWMLPHEFQKTKQGDCEDFAIFKAEHLLYNGFKKENLFFVSLTKQGSEPHMALLVDYTYVLDNNFSEVFTLSEYLTRTSYVASLIIPYETFHEHLKYRRKL